MEVEEMFKSMLIALILILSTLSNLLIQNFTFAQENKKIVTGYKDLEWGASLKTVTQKYPEIREISDEDQNFPGSKRYGAKYTEGSILDRTFVIWKEKLVLL